MVFKKKKFAISELIAEEKSERINAKDRLFFHDIINQTHGLLLYLGQKELHQKSVNAEEVKMLINEIKTIQSLVSDHFNYKHKNLPKTFEWVPFHYLKMAIDLMAETYFSGQKIELEYTSSSTEDALVYYPSFYRIMNNVIKNMAESRPKVVQIKISLSQTELKIETLNELSVGSVKNLPEYLERIILDESTHNSSGLGLESVYHVAEESGGHFTFEVKDGRWRNEIVLPTNKSNQTKIAA